jgi:hypothetical protein
LRPRRPLGRWLALALLAAGCAGGARDASAIADAEVAALRDAILALPGPGDSAEATAIARAALGGTARLAARYRMTWPPLLHNNLVHWGLRPRGLCCHWAEDLLRELERVPLVHYQSFWLTAYLGNRWREHNTPAIAPIGEDWTQSLVLDGWRNSGELVYARAVGDRYPWQLHPLDSRRDILRCMQN